MENDHYCNSYVFEQVFVRCQDWGTQISFAKAFPEHEDVVVRLWKRPPHLAALGIETMIMRIVFTRDDYLFYMNTMAPHFEEISVLNINGDFNGVNHLKKILTDLRLQGFEFFPSVTKCSIVDSQGYFDESDVHELTRMMPNLKSFSADCGLQGIFRLEKFKELEELNFSTLNKKYCPRFFRATSTSLRKFHVLQTKERILEIKSFCLPNLESIAMHFSLLEKIIDQLLTLPRLKHLMAIGARGEIEQQLLFVQILEEKASKITRISIDNFHLQLAKDWTKNLCRPLEFPNLKKIIFQNWTHRNAFLSEHLFDRGQIKTLACDTWSKLDGTKLMTLIKDHHNLEKLSILQCSADKSIVSHIETFLKREKEQGEQRPKLFIHDFCEVFNNLSREEIEYWKNNNYVTMEPPKNERYIHKPYAFRFDFSTA